MSRNKLVGIGLSVYNNFIFNYFYEKSSNFKDLTKSNIWVRFMIMIQRINERGTYKLRQRINVLKRYVYKKRI